MSIQSTKYIQTTSGENLQEVLDSMSGNSVTFTDIDIVIDEVTRIVEVDVTDISIGSSFKISNYITNDGSFFVDIGAGNIIYPFMSQTIEVPFANTLVLTKKTATIFIYSQE